MQQRHLTLNAKVQGGSPFPYVSASGEAVPQNSKVRSRSYAKVRSGIGLARSASIQRGGYGLHEIKVGIAPPNNSGSTFTWPGTLGNLDTYEFTIPSLNGSTAADSVARKMFGHVLFNESVTPDPATWPLAGTSSGSWESHIYPYGTSSAGATLPLGVLDQDTTSSYNGTGLRNPAAANLGAVSTSENNHTFTVITDNNLVFHCTEVFTVDWKNGGGAVVATFTVTYELICDTDDLHFPNYGGAGTITRMTPGRTISNARYASDFVNGLLYYLYQNYGCNHVTGASAAHPPTFGGLGGNPVTILDGVTSGSINATPFLWNSGAFTTTGAFGVWCPPTDGLFFQKYADEWFFLGYDLRVPRGNYTFTRTVFDLGGNVTSGPTTTTYFSQSFCRALPCEADGSLTKILPAAGAIPGVDYLRSDNGWVPRPPPGGTDLAKANAEQGDLMF